ncbi:hypothetical protein IHE45_12G040800 [Dioscorea alata]|uniref:Uncharacterized protein n=1 Tax=Dioscorea alata TaxID=55571 RepID=A0ACB7V1R1_DIOAL|nr:hypothetical protein IHE45_12G040800 [Dioscorea alata]
MCNYISCTLTTSLGNQTKGAKVIFPDVRLKQLQSPTNTAELMFENPNHFLVNSRSMEVGQRISPLAADEDLESDNVYVMFPMKRLNALLMVDNLALRRVSGGRTRVLKDFHQATPEFKYRLSVCRSRKPLLETIAEKSICPR